MSFLLKHYEKILLTVLLLVFIGLLVYLLMIFSQSSHVKESDLQIPYIKPDYARTNFKDMKFDLMSELQKNSVWLVSQPRKKGETAYTDFMVCFMASQCPHCKGIVPRIAFIEAPHKCPLCGGALPEPKRALEAQNDLGQIPEAVKKLLGLNPKSDIDNDDLDKDGFTNLDEYKYAVASSADENAIVAMLKDPLKHPPYATRLKVENIETTRLFVELKKVRGTKDKNNLEAEVLVKKRKGGKMETEFKSINSEIRIEADPYKIVEIIPDFVEEVNKRVGGMVKRDISKIILQQLSTGENVTVVVGGAQIDAPLKKVTLKDNYSGSEYSGTVKQQIKVGSPETGFESYLIQSAEIKRDKDSETKSAVIKKLDDNKIFELGARALAPLPAGRDTEDGARVVQPAKTN